MSIAMDTMAAAGVDTVGALERCINNEALYIKVCKKFLADRNYMLLKEDLCKTEKNYNDVLSHAHTLKGVCANLGFTKLYEEFALIVADIRADKYDRIENTFRTAADDYEEICDIISKL